MKKIELLKIISMLLIVISHSVLIFGSNNIIQNLNLGIVFENLIDIILNIIRCLGKVGNIIFIVCSSYYLLDKNKSYNKKIR